MSKIHEDAFLQDIREAIHRIQTYTLDLDEEGFQADIKTQDAVIIRIGASKADSEKARWRHHAHQPRSSTVAQALPAKWP